MPFEYELTWIDHANRWRKRYLGRTYYLKTDVGGKSDRDGYLAALNEWQRLKAYVDGFGPNPYTATGVLIPPENLQPIGQNQAAIELPRIELANDPPWI